MKFFAILTILSLLALVTAQEDAVLPDIADRAKECFKVKTTASQMKNEEGCKPRQVRIMITYGVTIGDDFSLTVKITLKCFKSKRAARVARRDTKCVKQLMKRCRCVVPELRQTCVLSQINTCAPQADKDILP